MVRAFFVLSISALFVCRYARAQSSRNVSLAWNEAALRGVRDSKLPAPEVARALAIVNTCMYDAWAAYDDQANGTQLKDTLRRPPSERTERNKEEAISYAAFRALTDVLPVDIGSVYISLLKSEGFDPDNRINGYHEAKRNWKCDLRGRAGISPS